MNDTGEESALNRKKKVGRAALAFLTVMLILTFLSNTINNLSLPRIEYEYPSMGSIVNEYQFDVTAEAIEVYNAYIPSAMTVLEINGRAGGKIKKGQLIMRLNTRGIEKQLLDEEDRYEQKKITLDMLSLSSGLNDLAEYDGRLAEAERELDKMLRKYERIKKLYEEKCETEENLENARDNLEDARFQYEKAVSERERAIQMNQEQSEKNEMEMKSIKLDMEIHERNIKHLKEQLKSGELTAPFDGIIREVSCEEGEMADPSRPLYTLVNTSKGCFFTGSIDSEKARYIEPGDEAEITTTGSWYGKINGKVVEIRDSRENKAGRKEIVIELSGDTPEEGQTGTARIKKYSKSYECLVSNSAIGQDNSGYFVYVLKEKRSYLGDEIYVQTARVTIRESDDKKTAVIDGLSADEKVVKSTDKPLSDGMRVICER